MSSQLKVKLIEQDIYYNSTSEIDAGDRVVAALGILHATAQVVTAAWRSLLK